MAEEAKNTPELNLNKFIKDNKEKLTTVVNFKGLETEVEYADADELRRITKVATSHRYVKHQKTEVLDDEKYRTQLAMKIRSWTFKGREFLLGDLAVLMNVNVPADRAKTPLPCNQENKKTLLKNVVGYALCIEDTFTEIENYRRNQQELEDRD